MVSKAPGDALQQRLRICHVSVIWEDALRSDVGQRHDASPLVERIELLGGGQGLVQTDGAHVQRGLEELVVDVGVVLALAHVGTHANAVQDEVHFAAEVLHGPFKQLLQVFFARGVGGNDRSVATQLGQVVDFPHAHGHGGIGQHNFSALCVGFQRHFPGDGHVVEGSEDDALFSFQKIVRHGSNELVGLGGKLPIPCDMPSPTTPPVLHNATWAVTAGTPSRSRPPWFGGIGLWRLGIQASCPPLRCS